MHNDFFLKNHHEHYSRDLKVEQQAPNPHGYNIKI